MFKNISLSTLLLLALACGAILHAQPAITSVRPEAAAPGDEVVITGTNLALVTHVRFTGNVGGFVGIWNVNVTPTSVSATQVRATVPVFGNFVGPSAVPPSSPQGTLLVRDAGGLLSSTLGFYFMEETMGFVGTAGLGNTQSNGLRAATSFTISGGAPTSPGPGFQLALVNAVPFSSALLVLGSPDPAPFFPVGDGLIGIDITQPVVFPLPLQTVPAAGELITPLAIPGGLGGSGLTIAAEYVLTDGSSGAPVIANALVISY